MPSYVVESFLANTRSAVDDARERSRLLTDDVNGVRYVRTTFLPGDETVLHLFEATSAEALRQAACDAALSYERIVEALEASTESGEEGTP